MKIKFVPITGDLELMKKFLVDKFFINFFKTYQKLYTESGFQFPWIGYFVLFEDELIGVGGFKGLPMSNKVELEYGVSPEKKGPGYATRICKILKVIAHKENPEIRLTKKTILGDTASAAILRRNGFIPVRKVADPNIGIILEWELDKSKSAGGSSNTE